MSFDYTADLWRGKDALRQAQGVPKVGPPTNPLPEQVGHPLEAPLFKIRRVRLVRRTWPQGAGASCPW